MVGSGLAARLNGLALEEAAAPGLRDDPPVHAARSQRARAFYEREGWRTDAVAFAEPMLGLDLVEYRRDL